MLFKNSILFAITVCVGLSILTTSAFAQEDTEGRFHHFRIHSYGEPLPGHKKPPTLEELKQFVDSLHKAGYPINFPQDLLSNQPARKKRAGDSTFTRAQKEAPFSFFSESTGTQIPGLLWMILTVIFFVCIAYILSLRSKVKLLEMKLSESKTYDGFNWQQETLAIIKEAIANGKLFYFEFSEGDKQGKKFKFDTVVDKKQ